MVRERAIKLLELATHPATPEAEGLSALRRLRSMTQGGTVSDLFREVSDSRSQPKPFMSYGEKMETIHRLEDENSRLKGQVTALENRVSKLTIELQSLKMTPMKPVRAGGMTYHAFAEEVKRRLQSHSDWIVNFCKQTGFTDDEINLARDPAKRDPTYRVPKKWVEALSSLRPVRLRYMTDWTLAEVRRLRTLVEKEGKADDEVAPILSQEFGRIITIEMVTKVRSHSRNGKGVFADPVFGGPIVLPKQDRNISMPWGRFPDIENKACQKFVDGVGIGAIAGYVQNEFAKRGAKMTVNDNQITQRMYNSAPPKSIAILRANGERTDWAELWFLGNKIKGDRKGWLNILRERLIHDDSLNSEELRKQRRRVKPGVDPNDFVRQNELNHLRTEVRNKMVEAGEEIPGLVQPDNQPDEASVRAAAA